MSGEFRFAAYHGFDAPSRSRFPLARRHESATCALKRFGHKRPYSRVVCLRCVAPPRERGLPCSEMESGEISQQFRRKNERCSSMPSGNWMNLVGGEHRTAVEEAVKRCLIHNTLLHPPKITLDIKDSALATAA